MSDILVPSSTLPAVTFKTLLHTPSHHHQGKSIPHSKSGSRVKINGEFVTQAIKRTFREANNFILSWKDGLSADERLRVQLQQERRQILCLRMKTADTQDQWEAAAKELDALEGNDEWKEDASGSDYNSELIAQRLHELDDARASCDMDLLMYLIRTALSRDLGGMDNVDLYRHSYIGTKKLIELYVESAIATIDAVVTQTRCDPTIRYRDYLEGMLYARQSFGRSALLLSGGGTFGMSHIGVLKALFEAKLLPRIISGASAGSIVAAVMCTRTDEEIPQSMKEFAYGDLSVFEDETDGDSVLQHLRRLLTEGSWSDIRHLTRVMRSLTGDLTFQEAYNRTRRILNICVSTASVYELPRLLNYVTAPNVLIWSAVAASCSVPLLFSSARILVKDPVTGEHCPWNPSPQKWIDGSVDNDLPMTRLSEMFNVNHFIVSQVNPHVVPFLSKEDRLSPDGNPGRPKPDQGDELHWIDTLATLAKDEALHRLQFLAEMGIFPNLATKFRSIISQRYSGDITILPGIGIHDLPRLLANPDPDFMLRMSLAGERATWPKLSRIRDRCAIELALDNAVHRLRARVVFSESQQDLRKLRYSYGNLRGQRSTFEVPSPSSENHQRHRRRSGGSTSMASMARHGLFNATTMDGAAEEEYFELKPVSSLLSIGRPMLKRASRSQQSDSSKYRPATAPAGDTTPPFSPGGSSAANPGSTKQKLDFNVEDVLVETRHWQGVDMWKGDNVEVSDDELSNTVGGGTDSELEKMDIQSRTSPETTATKTEDGSLFEGSSGGLSDEYWD